MRRSRRSVSMQPLDFGRHSGRTLQEIAELGDFSYLEWLWFTYVVNQSSINVTKGAKEYLTPIVAESCKRNGKYLSLETVLIKGMYKGYDVRSIAYSHPEYIEYLHYQCNYYLDDAVVEMVKKGWDVKNQFKVML